MLGGIQSLGQLLENSKQRNFEFLENVASFYRFWLEREGVFRPILNKKFFLELKGIFHFIPSLRWEVALVYLKQSIGDNLIFCFTSKFQKLLKYAQNQRAKTIFVFFTKTYLLKQSIFFNILLKNRLVSSEENTEKKRNGIRERKESEFSLGLWSGERNLQTSRTRLRNEMRNKT